jgi:hypothetical protein
MFICDDGRMVVVADDEHEWCAAVRGMLFRILTPGDAGCMSLDDRSPHLTRAHKTTSTDLNPFSQNY